MYHPPKIIYSVRQWELSGNKVSGILVALQKHDGIIKLFSNKSSFGVVKIKLFKNNSTCLKQLSDQ